MSQVRYVSEILGANASSNRVMAGEVELTCSTTGRTDWCALRVQPNEPWDGPVALFATREAARAVVLGALWNGQIFRVRAARGKIRAEGQEVA